MLYMEKGGMIFLFFSLLGIVALARLSVSFLRNSLPATSSNKFGTLIRHFIEKFLAIVFLLFAVNLPSLLGAGVFGVLGYRLVFSISVMFILLQIWFLRIFKMTFKNITNKVLSTGIISIWLVSTSIISLQHIYEVASNYNQELRIMRSAISRFDLDRWNRIVVISIDRNRSFVRRFLHHEFGFGIRHFHNAIPFLWEKIDKKSYYRKNVSLLITTSKWRELNELQENDYLIDLNQDTFLNEIP